MGVLQFWDGQVGRMEMVALCSLSIFSIPRKLVLSLGGRPYSYDKMVARRKNLGSLGMNIRRPVGKLFKLGKQETVLNQQE